MFDFFRNKYKVTFFITYLGHNETQIGVRFYITADSEGEALVIAEEQVRNTYNCVEIHSVSINGKDTYLVR